MVKLLVLSDLHLEFAPFVPDAAAAALADVVVLAGDIHKGTAGIAWARQAFADKPIVYVAGNHEFYGNRWESLIDELRQAGRTYDVNFLENESVTIQGVRFLGCTLWSDFEFFGADKRRSAMFAAERGMNDYRMIKASPLPEIYWRAKPHRVTSHHTLQRHRQSRAWLEAELAQGERARTVVVIHHCPHLNSTAPEYRQDLLTAAYGSRLPDEVLARAPLWIHGHTHHSFDYLVGGAGGGARVICNPRGYPLFKVQEKSENAQFNAALVAQLKTGEDAGSNSEAEAVLTRALLRAAALLGIEQWLLAKLLGVSEATVEAFARGQQFLLLRSKSAEAAAHLVSIYQALSALVGENEEQLRLWMNSYNRALHAVPRDAICTTDGLACTLSYLSGDRR